MSKVILDKISDAIEDVKQGKIIIVVDDENRENEGDFICAADLVSPEIINFMAKHARGLVCMPITEKRSRKLNLYPMVSNNTDPMDTAFTVSVDLKGSGVTSGISASDRSKTIKAIVNNNTKPDDLARPGHIFPLIAKDGGSQNLRPTARPQSLHQDIRSWPPLSPCQPLCRPRCRARHLPHTRKHWLEYPNAWPLPTRALDGVWRRGWCRH